MKALLAVPLLLALAAAAANPSPGVRPAQLEPSVNRRIPSMEGLAIIVDRNNPASNISMAELREIFLGDRHWWAHDRRITPIAMEPGTAERQTVLKKVYKMDERDLGHYFFFEIYRGAPVTPPTALQNAALVRKFVASNPGAIGYLRASDVDGSVKVLRINGLLPGDDGYPLRLRRRISK
jgi:ABC-type phosphate transport system substrate-binding protein